MNVLQFPVAQQMGPMERLAAPPDKIDERAAELMAEACETVKRFPAVEIAKMLAYAAARLERTGFRMFN